MALSQQCIADELNMRNFLCAGALYQGLHLEVLRTVSSPAIQDQVRKAWAMSIAEHLLALSALSYADRSRQPQLPSKSSGPTRARSHDVLICHRFVTIPRTSQPPTPLCRRWCSTAHCHGCASETKWFSCRRSSANID